MRRGIAVLLLSLITTGLVATGQPFAWAQPTGPSIYDGDAWMQSFDRMQQAEIRYRYWDPTDTQGQEQAYREFRRTRRDHLRNARQLRETNMVVKNLVDGRQTTLTYRPASTAVSRGTLDTSVALADDVIDLRNVKPKGGSLVARGARLAGRPLPLIGWGLTAGEIVWWGYREFYPPPDWDFEDGEDPELGAPVQTGGWHRAIQYRDADPAEHHIDQAEAVADAIEEELPTIFTGEDGGLDRFYLGSHQSKSDLEDIPEGGGTTVAAIRGDSDAKIYEDSFGDVESPPPPLTTGCDGNAPSGVVWCGRSYVETEEVTGVGQYVMSLTVHYQTTVVWWRVYFQADVVAPEETTVPMRGRVVAEYGCYDEGQDFEYHHSNETDWYESHDDRESIPHIGCLEGQELTYVDVYRELEDGSKRWLMGGPWAEAQDGNEVEIYQPGVSGPSTNIRLAPIATPSGLTTEEEDTWEQCVEDGDCILTGVRESDGTNITPGRDHGWWTQERSYIETEYGCMLVAPDGSSAVVPMDYCGHQRWEEGPDGEIYQREHQAEEPIPDPDPEPDPDTEDYPEPDLDSPVPDGGEIPSGGPQPSQGCMANYEDGGGFTSWIVFRGTACALQWAFLPSETFMLELTQRHSDATSGRLPFALQPVFTEHVPEIVPMPGQATCSVNVWEFPPNHLTPSGFPQLAIPCEPPWNHTIPYALMSTGVVIMVVRGIWNMLSKPLGAPQDGFADNTLGGQLS